MNNENHNTTSAESETHDSHQHGKSRKKIYFLGAIIIFVIALFAAITYTYTFAGNGWKAAVFKNLPLPIAIVGNNPVFGTEYYQRLDVANKIVEAQGLQIDNTEEVVMRQLIDNKALTILAKQKGVTVSEEELDANLEQILTSDPTATKEEIIQSLQDAYGMSIDQFRNQILKENLLLENLGLWFVSQEQLNQESYNTARNLLSKIEEGQNFADVAKQYTQDINSQPFAGDSGFISYQEMLPEFKAVVKDLAINQPTMVASRSGLHIIMVSAVQEAEDGSLENKKFQIQQIFIQPSSVDEWMTSQIDQMRQIIFI
ncbi:MAG: peptidylprolyl isomerase [Candidatus Doudnabacteria bacterium]